MSAVAASLLPKPFLAYVRKIRGPRIQQWAFGIWTVAVFAFLYIPILLLIVFSFNDSRLGLAWEGFTTRWYEQLFRNKVLIGAFKNSMIIATVTTVLSTALGTIGAWLLYRYRFPFQRAIGLLIFVPMVIPEVLMGVSLMVLFSNLLNIPLGYATVIIGHTTFCFPFVLVGVQARLQGIDPFLEEAAMDLGATPIQAFWKVIVPYLMPAIIAGALMSFTLSFDEYIVTVFTSGAGSQTLPLQVYGMARKGLDPQLNALSALFVLGTIILVLFSELIKKRT
jgi:ABC-type spermidine/putrescine transport system, permease component II